MKAFHGDAKLRGEMIERVRARRSNGELFSAPILRWMPEQKAFSISAALAQTGDVAEFEKATGIPIHVAMLCEALSSMCTVTFEDKSKPTGFDIVQDADSRRFEMEWIDAIRAGADLSGVAPRFMVYFLETMLRPDFPLADHIEPGVRAIAARILDCWKRELAGGAIDGATWRAIRKDAVAASEQVKDPWCYPVAYFTETLAWPLSDMPGEFLQPFGYLMSNAIAYLRRPFYVEEHRNRGELSLVGFRRLDEARAEGITGEEATKAFFDTMPEIRDALMPLSPEANLRYKKDQVRAFEVTTPPMRRMMDEMLKLIADAGAAA
jgi:hypothetical protein